MVVFFSTALTAGLIVVLVLAVVWILFVIFIKPETDNNDEKLHTSGKTAKASSSSSSSAFSEKTTGKTIAVDFHPHQAGGQGALRIRGTGPSGGSGPLIASGQGITDPIISSTTTTTTRGGGGGSTTRVTFVKDHNLWV